MKKVVAVLAVLIGVGMVGVGLSAAQEYEFQTGFHMDWWTSPNGDVGQQIYFPLVSGIRYHDFGFKVITAGAYSRFSGNGSNSVSLGAMLDTKLNLSYEFSDKWPVDILVALDLNLPTGTTNLTRKEMLLVMDPDLVSVASLGEGFNVNPSVIFSRQWGEKWVTGIGFGYNARGEYDYSRKVQNYRPGDVFTIVPEVRYYLTEQWMSRLYGNFSTYSKAEANDQDFSEQGDFYLIGASLSYTRKDWAAGLNVYGIIRDKNTLIIQGTDLRTSPTCAYTQGDEIVADLSFNYLLDDKTTLKSLVRYLWMKGNGEPLSSPLHWGERNLFSLSLGVARKFTPNLEAEVGLKWLNMHDEPNWNHFNSDQSYYGLGGQVMITGSF